MLIHDFDDERTMEEEELNESDASCQDELNELQKVLYPIFVVVVNVK